MNKLFIFVSALMTGAAACGMNYQGRVALHEGNRIAFGRGHLLSDVVVNHASIDHQKNLEKRVLIATENVQDESDRLKPTWVDCLMGRKKTLSADTPFQKELEEAEQSLRQYQERKKQALAWLHKAAGFGHIPSIKSCAYFYERHQQDQERAHTCYVRAAELGDADAQFIVAQRYLQAAGVEQDEQEAFAWLNKAAAPRIRSHVDPKSLIGRQKCIKVYHPQANLALAKWYVKGDKFQVKNPQKAFEHFSIFLRYTSSKDRQVSSVITKISDVLESDSVADIPHDIACKLGQFIAKHPRHERAARLFLLLKKRAFAQGAQQAQAQLVKTGAFDALRKEAHAGNCKACQAVSRFMIDMSQRDVTFEHCEHDIKKAYEEVIDLYLKFVCKRGVAVDLPDDDQILGRAYIDLAMRYKKERNSIQEIYCCRMAANNNHPIGQMAYGTLLVNGQVPRIMGRKAMQLGIDLLKKSADAGCEEALVGLLQVYNIFREGEPLGCGVLADVPEPKKIVARVEQVAKKRPDFLCDLGVYYSRRRMQDTFNYEKSCSIFQQAIEHNEHLARFHLGTLYHEQGYLFLAEGKKKGALKTLGKAIGMFESFIDQKEKCTHVHHCTALARLADLYSRPELGNVQDLKKAVNLICQSIRAADGKDTSARNKIIIQCLNEVYKVAEKQEPLYAKILLGLAKQHDLID